MENWSFSGFYYYFDLLLVKPEDIAEEQVGQATQLTLKQKQL